LAASNRPAGRRMLPLGYERRNPARSLADGVSLERSPRRRTPYAVSVRRAQRWSARTPTAHSRPGWRR
jgi:hypothetical protein